MTINFQQSKYMHCKSYLQAMYTCIYMYANSWCTCYINGKGASKNIQKVKLEVGINMAVPATCMYMTDTSRKSKTVNMWKG